MIVDVAKAIQSIQDASRYSKNTMYSEEARSFIDNCMPKIVSILVQQIDLGDIELNSSENEHVKSCLELALEIVSNDLAAASKKGGECKTLPVLTEIFNEVTGLQDRDRFDMYYTFRQVRGFRHLGCYLLSANDRRDVDSYFPQLDSVYTILSVVDDVALVCNVDDAHNICNAVMHRLCCLDEVQLSRIDDDSIEICSLVHQICTHLHLSKDAVIVDFFSLYRDFVLKLIKSKTIRLKLLGLTELRNIIKKSAKNRPNPRVYVVNGAGLEEVNGIYEVDPKLMTGDGWLVSNYAAMTYKKRDSLHYLWENEYAAECNRDEWNLFRLLRGERETLYCNRGRDGFDLTRPREDGWRVKNGVRPSPTVKPLGLVLPAGEKTTLEHDLVEWIVNHDVLVVVARDIISGHTDISNEAVQAMKSMLNAIERLLNLLVEIIPEQAEFDSDQYKVNLEGVERASAIVNSIMKYFVLSICEEELECISIDFITETCEQLKKIHAQFSNLFPQSEFDFQIFQRVLILQLLVSRSSSRNELGQKELILLRQTSTSLATSDDNEQCTLDNESTMEKSSKCATKAQENMWIIVRQLLSAAEMSISLQEHQFQGVVPIDDHEQVATDVKQIVKNCLEALIIENSNDLHANFVRCVIVVMVEIYARASNSSRQSASDFHDFTRAVILKSITSSNHAVEQVGWVTLSQQLGMSVVDRPPPRTYVVESRQSENLNGVYDLDSSQLTEEGRVRDQRNVRYIQNPVLHDDENEQECDDERKNCADNANYFILYRTVTNDEIEFSFSACDSGGVSRDCGELEFSCTPKGLAVPEGEEFKTPEHEWAKWIIENPVIDIAYKNGTPSEAALACITKLVEFLTNICANETDEKRPITDMLVLAKEVPLQQQDWSTLRELCCKRKLDMGPFNVL